MCLYVCMYVCALCSEHAECFHTSAHCIQPRAAAVRAALVLDSIITAVWAEGEA